MKFEDKTFPEKLKGIAKGLEIYGFGILNIISEIKVEK